MRSLQFTESKISYLLCFWKYKKTLPPLPKCPKPANIFYESLLIGHLYLYYSSRATTKSKGWLKNRVTQYKRALYRPECQNWCGRCRKNCFASEDSELLSPNEKCFLGGNVSRMLRPRPLTIQEAPVYTDAYWITWSDFGSK